MKTPLRVVMVVPTYLPETFGGAEQQCRKLCLALESLGIDVTIVAPRLLVTTKSSEKHGHTRIERLRLRYAPNLGGRYLPSFLLWSLKLAWWLYSERNRYDIIHVVHGRLHAVPAALAGRALGKPTLIKLGRGGAHFDLKIVKEKRLGGPLFSRLLARLPTAFIANSREIVSDLQAIGIPDLRICRLPNGVDVPRIRDRAGAYGHPQVRFLYFGRLDPEKALDKLIKGFAKLGAGPHARLTIVGAGTCENELRTLVHHLSVEDQVVFRLPVSDVGPLLQDADFHVSTSLSEGMSNALLESMSWGVPAIVSRVSGVEDIVDDGASGFVFEPGDDQGYLEALKKAMRMTAHDWQRMSWAACNTIKQSFAIDDVAERHVVIYRGLVANSGPASCVAS